MTKTKIIDNEGYVGFWLPNGSCAEFSKDDFDIFSKDLEERGFFSENPIYFFNRLKVTKEGCGDGSRLMDAVVKYFDEKEYDIINHVSAYGSMSQKRLVQFYKKYGFIHVYETLFYRRAECL